MNLELRDYQRKAVDRVKRAWWFDLSLLGVSPTRTGKTPIGVMAVREHSKPGQRILVATNKANVVDQWVETFGKWWPDSDVGVVQADRDDYKAQIVVGTYGTLTRPERIRRIFDAGKVSYLVFDEAHRKVPPTSVRIIDAVTKHNRFVYHLYLTATPVRTDRVLIGDNIAKVAFNYSIEEMQRRGWLVKRKDIEVNMETLELASWIERHHAQRKKIIVVKTVDECAALAWMMPRARAYTGDLTRNERDRILFEYQEGDVDTIVTAGAIGEGDDINCTEMVVLSNGTKSNTPYTQIVGRALGLYPGKREAIIVHNNIAKQKIRPYKDKEALGDRGIWGAIKGVFK